MREDCIIWIGACLPTGYGRIYVNGKAEYAHRHAYEVANGPVPDELFVLHRCDTRNCVNPEHLYIGTALQNMRDRDARGRSGTRKLAQADVDGIRNATSSYRETAESYGVSKSTVYLIRKGLTWRGLGDDEGPPPLTTREVTIDEIPESQKVGAIQVESRYRATHLKQTLDERGSSVSWLARRIGVTRQIVDRIVQGHQTTDQGRAAAIADALGVSVESLFDLT